jgi:hypothetical protein
MRDSLGSSRPKERFHVFMALAHWPPRRIAPIWITGLSVWALLVFLGTLQIKAERRQFEREHGILQGVAFSPANTLSTAGRDSLLGLALAVLRLPDSARNAAITKALAVIRDSTIPLAQLRDSIAHFLDAPAQVTPVQKDSLKRFGESLATVAFGPPLAALGSGLEKAAPMLYSSVALFLAVPTILVAFTLTWWWLRNASRRRSQAAAA